MKLGFNFVVIKYVASTGRDVLEDLTRLGFKCLNISRNGEVSFWRQDNCLIQLQASDRREFAGIGLLVDDIGEALALGAVKDLQTGWYKLTDPAGFEIYLLQDDDLEDTFLNHYQVITADIPDTGKGLNKFSGLVINRVATVEVKDFYRSLGFKYNETASMSKFLTFNNFFTILMGEVETSKKAILYADCDDVLYTLRLLSLADAKLSPASNQDSLGLGLDYKISAYDACSFGNSESYSIEKIIPDALPSTDIIVRERKKKLHISEEIVKSHYNSDK